MNFNNFSDQTRIWVYPISRQLNEQEVFSVEQQCNHFCADWTAHNHALKAKAEVFESRWLFLLVDESLSGASGCSIDKSVHFLEQLGSQMQVDFFDRMQFGWLDAAGNVCFGNLTDAKEAVDKGEITFDTLMLNSLVSTKKEYDEKWQVPFGKSWQRRVI
jgi:hypothetical protein